MRVKKIADGLSLILPDEDGIVTKTGDPRMDHLLSGPGNQPWGGVIVTPGKIYNPHHILIDGKPATMDDLYRRQMGRAVEQIKTHASTLRPEDVKRHINGIQQTLQMITTPTPTSQPEPDPLDELFQTHPAEQATTEPTLDPPANPPANPAANPAANQVQQKGSNDSDEADVGAYGLGVEGRLEDRMVEVRVRLGQFGSFMLRVDDVIFAVDDDGRVRGLGLIVDRRRGLSWAPPANAEGIEMVVGNQKFQVTGKFAGSFVWPSGQYDLIILSVEPQHHDQQRCDQR